MAKKCSSVLRQHFVLVEDMPIFNTVAITKIVDVGFHTPIAPSLYPCVREFKKEERSQKSGESCQY